jgi:hypothetical protein
VGEWMGLMLPVEEVLELDMVATVLVLFDASVVREN